MIRTLLSLSCLIFAPLASASSLDQATLAAMRLSEAPNYAWSSSVEDDARSYVKTGKHHQNGFTWVTLPMLDSLSRRLGRTAGPDVEAIFGAGNSCVIRLGERWKTVRQLPKATREAEEFCITVLPPTGRIRTADMPADINEPDPFPPVIVLTPAVWREEDENKPFSNARLAASPPHEELALIVSSWANVVTTGDMVRGVLSDTGARLLLCPGSEAESTPVAAAGEFTLHLKDNAVTRYQLKLEGVLLVGKKKTVVVRQSSDTAIRDVGKTTFEVPEEARLKLQN